MNKKIITAFILLACLAFMPITSTADYPTGELGYSDEMVVDAEFEWTVSKLATTGDFTYFADMFYIGDIGLTQGDKIKFVVLEDPDNATGAWYDIFVDDVKVIGPESFFIGFYYGFSSFFVNPVTYTNTTGTYNIYEQIFEELVELNDHYVTSVSYEMYGITIQGDIDQTLEYKLKGDVFSISMSTKMSMTMSGGGTEMSSEGTSEYKTSVNIVTGLLGTVEMKMEAESDYQSGSFHLLIDSDYANIVPYSWAFSFLGITVIAAVVALAKRKRK
ncbi:MAG: hypothetical protein GOP50_07935 [Candidatus Heimdallarchaeota archaeon]|nr:hypothetical protein [Candidatus Heimdallarchaeota archaeon]